LILALTIVWRFSLLCPVSVSKGSIYIHAESGFQDKIFAYVYLHKIYFLFNIKDFFLNSLWNEP
jgi:hypothetical protein